MRLLFKQRFFSWLDSYDVYDEAGNPAFRVEGRLAWGHRLVVYDAAGNELGTVQERVMTFLPKFEIYIGERLVGEIHKEFTFFKPVYTLDFADWTVEGDLLGWDYTVSSPGREIARVSKQLFNFTDTYEIDVERPENALYALMIVLAIDAAQCSAGNG